MKKTETFYLRDMLDHAYKLQALAARTSRTQYDTDEVIRAACRYWIQVIGEAAAQVSTSFQEAQPQIEWRPMIAMRNRIVHDYLGVDDNTVWDTIREGIPKLIQQLEALLSASPPDDPN